MPSEHTIPMFKVCAICRLDLPLGAFGRNVRALHGRQAYCRSCHKERYSSPPPTCVDCGKKIRRPLIRCADCADPNPSQRCLCGCGRETAIAPQTCAREGRVKGKHYRYIAGHHRRTSAVAFVEEDRGYATPCWIWQRSINRDGYGSTEGRSAHIVFYERRYGAVPDGLQLDHLCRVRCCVNPDHMEPVTAAVNIRRGAVTKMTVDNVRLIREIGRSLSSREVAEIFRISPTHVKDILRFRVWKDV